MAGEVPTEFEDMKVKKFQWLLRGFCCELPSLKKAVQYHAFKGIVLSILILLVGTGGNFLIAGLKAHATYGVIFLAIETVLLIYNLLLLKSVRDNRTAGVFKIIKVGCLVSLYIELITEFAFLLLHILLFNDLRRSGVPIGVLIAGIFWTSALLFLTALVIYGIHGDKPKIVSAYIYIKGILFALVILLFLMRIIYIVVAYSNHGFYIDVTIIAFILFVISGDYYLKLFLLQVNMMTIDQVILGHRQSLNI